LKNLGTRTRDQQVAVSSLIQRANQVKRLDFTASKAHFRIDVENR
jgi:hypothetical protein